MTFFPTGAALILCAIAFGVGGLPIIAWLVQGLTHKRLTDLGTGNISVAAAFYHGGTKIGVLAVLSEALKGIAVVLLARLLLPETAAWEVIGLIALVLGRFTLSRGAGTTNVVWGYVAHDWTVAVIVWVLSGVLFALVRQRQVARLGVLALIPLVEAVRNPDAPLMVGAATVLSLVMALIYRQIPDDLALSAPQPQASSFKMFQYLRGQDVIGSLNDKPQVSQMGHKAATLAHLKQQGYAVPMGWTLAPTTAARSLVQHLERVEKFPWQQTWIVRSSALDEDGAETSAAGQYQSVAQVTNATALTQAVAQCRASYDDAGAAQYRRDRGLIDQSGMALLIQKQVKGLYSGVAFSRDPVEPGAAVVVEALAGGAAQVVSGQVTPQQYRLHVDDLTLDDFQPDRLAAISASLNIATDAAAVPAPLIERVATLARHLERHYHGIPQDIEWSFDGETLWLLQARPITTLTPIWTRKIAAEVIPGVIRPLTWSINRPLTCGVWGKIFTLVLGQRAAGLDFGQTATLHYSRAYFNATLLGQIFRRMGLPPESLEFLTLGAKFSPPPVLSTLRNLPGLLRLLSREWHLLRDFERDDRQSFAPTIEQLRQTPAATLTPTDLLSRIDLILHHLEKATYYNILAPLGFALLRSLFQVSETALDQRQQPEVASIQAIKALARSTQQQFPQLISMMQTAAPQSRWEKLTNTAAGQAILPSLEAMIERYGDLSEVGTDIAVPTWREDPQPVRDLFIQFLLNPPSDTFEDSSRDDQPPAQEPPDWRYRQVQQRLDLKGRVARVYLILLAELRGSLLALEQAAIAQSQLAQTGDAFFLTYAELQACMTSSALDSAETVQQRVTARRSQFAEHQSLTAVPFIVYGDDPPPDPSGLARPDILRSGVLQGIGASAGQVQGPVRVLTTLKLSAPLAPNTIIVVPYTDAGWAPLLAQAAGLVAEVGGSLSHGAIVAREYKIPAVMNIDQATQRFQDGQMIRLDGRAGTVEIVDDAT